jgi:hypothetical protein
MIRRSVRVLGSSVVNDDNTPPTDLTPEQRIQAVAAAMANHMEKPPTAEQVQRSKQVAEQLRREAEENENRQRKSHRRKMYLAVAFGVISTSVSVMALIGQSFSLRQARALEAIEHQLERINERLDPHPTPSSPAALPTP